MKIEDLRWKGPREFRAEPTGDYIINRKGRRVPVLEGVEFVKTVGVGTMTISEWYQQMRTAIKEEGQEELLKKVIDYCRRLVWLKTEKQIIEYALECIESEAYLAWEDFDDGVKR